MSNFIFHRTETPPNTPQHAQIASQNQERANRVLESPKIRCTPRPTIQHPFIPPLNFGPVNIPIAQNAPIAEDSFLPPAPAPPQYQHLPPALAQQLAALPPMPAPVCRGRHRQHQPPPPPPPPPPPLAPNIVPPLLQPHLPVPPPLQPQPQPRHYNRVVDQDSIAREPFDPSWPVHSLGKMDIPCSACGALHWMAEKLTNSSNTNPHFGICCVQGKIKLAHLQNLPPELDNLFRGQNSQAKEF